MAYTSYIEMRVGEQWQDVAGAFMTYCAREMKLDRCGCHEGEPDGAPSDGKRYAALSIPDHSLFLLTHLLDWASGERRAIVL